MKNVLWKLLFVFCPGIDDLEIVDLDDDPDPEPEPSDDPDPSDPDPSDDPDPEPEPKQLSRAQREIISLRERAQKAEEDHRRAQAELEVHKRQANPQPQQQTDEQKLWEAEEATLKNPECTDWQRYSIQANRSARKAERTSQAVLQEARDLSDKAEFARIAQDKPKTYERYKDRVEEMKKQNPGAPRKALLALLMGQDMLEGKLKAETKSTKQQGSAARGKTPGARSDVSGGGRGLSEAEKREKRLENVRF